MTREEAREAIKEAYGNSEYTNEIIKTLEQEPCDDCISRVEVKKIAKEMYLEVANMELDVKTISDCISCTSSKCREVLERKLQALSSVTPQEPRWIPVSERLPEDLEPVNITWVNHNPESYYADIKDKPFTATGHYCKGRWYWYSNTCQDYLEEYGRCDVDEIDTDIEVTAWMPLPEPYKAESEDKE